MDPQDTPRQDPQDGALGSPFQDLTARELRETLRLAGRRAEQARRRLDEERRRQEYLRAAVEMGIPEETLRRAAEEVLERRARRRRLTLNAAMAAGVASLLAGGVGVRQERERRTEPQPRIRIYQDDIRPLRPYGGLMLLPNPPIVLEHRYEHRWRRDDFRRR